MLKSTGVEFESTKKCNIYLFMKENVERWTFGANI